VRQQPLKLRKSRNESAGKESSLGPGEDLALGHGLQGNYALRVFRFMRMALIAETLAFIETTLGAFGMPPLLCSLAPPLMLLPRK